MIDFEGGYSADGGALKIYSENFSVDFLNGVGDGSFDVTVQTGFATGREWEFINSFIVKDNDCCFISSYDCSEDPIYTFPIGRYGVYRDNEGNMLISLWDLCGVV